MATFSIISLMMFTSAVKSEEASPWQNSDPKNQAICKTNESTFTENEKTLTNLIENHDFEQEVLLEYLAQKLSKESINSKKKKIMDIEEAVFEGLIKQRKLLDDSFKMGCVAEGYYNEKSNNYKRVYKMMAHYLRH